jgi:hypothetical protein
LPRSAPVIPWVTGSMRSRRRQSVHDLAGPRRHRRRSRLEPRARPTANHDDLAERSVKCLDRSLRSTFIFIPIDERGGQNLSPYQIRLLSRSRGVLGHIEPNLKNVASLHTAVQDDPSKYPVPIIMRRHSRNGQWREAVAYESLEKLHGAF